MHELSIAEALVNQLADIVRREHAARVLSVTIAVGSLSGVDPDALEMAFPLAAEGSPAAGAALTIRRVPARLLCAQCGEATVSEDPSFLCSHCGSPQLTLAAGQELRLVEAELEDGKESTSEP